jgi:hypothetical protein
MVPLTELIEIYSRRLADDVPGDPEYVTLCQGMDANSLFHHARHRVETLKRKLEKEVGIQQTAQKQVKYSLKFLQRVNGSQNQEDQICYQLTRKTYFPHWTAKQQQYFEDIVAKIKAGQEYFLSFTQRYRGEGAGNPVNSLHRYLIQSYGLLNPQDSTKNELAHMLDNVLRSSQRHQFNGFYFPAHEDDSAEVKKKVDDALDQALVFIQLVQNEMFSRHYEDRFNFCHSEYGRALASAKPMIYLFADGIHPDDLISEEDADFSLDNWYQYIRKIDCVDLAPTIVAEETANVVANRRKLQERLVEKVQCFREALWNNVPSDLD